MFSNVIRIGAINSLALGLLLGCGVGVQEEAVAQSESASVSTSSAIATGTIVGKVVFEGKTPRIGKLPVESDPHCVKLRDGKPLLTDTFVFGEGQSMANVIVSVVSNLPKIKHTVPSEPFTLSQQGCQYEPHVFAVQAGQELQVVNPDGINHNVHLLPEKNKEMNRAMANSTAKFIYHTKHAEEPFVIKCDVHSWMKAYCGVFDHPYFSVTEVDGKFSIEGLPAGTYDVEAWHEFKGFGIRRGTVTIEEGKGVEINFTYSRPKKK